MVKRKKTINRRAKGKSQGEEELEKNEQKNQQQQRILYCNLHRVITKIILQTTHIIKGEEESMRRGDKKE